MQQRITFSEFDADAFGLPFYRVHDVDPSGIAQELQTIRERHNTVVVDAKLPAGDVANSRLLSSLGFRKVCMQITLRSDLNRPGQQPDDVAVVPRLDLSEATIRQHAENFTSDRFSLDPLLPPEGTRRLYENWVRNSLTGGRKQIVHSGVNFCTLGLKEQTATIDLVSVLDHGRGIGKKLIAAALRCAREHGATELFVTTECENTPAWNLYLRAGCAPAKFTAAFHFVQQ